MDLVSQLDEHVRRIVALHFDERHGSPYWLEQQRALRLNAIEAIHCFDDLEILGYMDEAALFERPVTDFVPISILPRLVGAIVTDTGGTTGRPKRTLFTREEFKLAFVDPFVCMARHAGFPNGLVWLFVGPSGPHVIGQAAAACATALGGHQPFTVDLDPRWFRKLPLASLGRERYLQHIVDQALDVLRSQPVEALFTTPTIIHRLANAMNDTQRERIRGVHYGGQRIEVETLRKAQTEWFPHAVHLAGYGNSLFGVCMEPSGEPTRPLRYFPFGPRHQVRIGDHGRVLMYRLDETMLIAKLAERDSAKVVAPPNVLARFGFGQGVENPAPRVHAAEVSTGIY